MRMSKPIEFEFHQASLQPTVGPFGWNWPTWDVAMELAGYSTNLVIGSSPGLVVMERWAHQPAEVRRRWDFQFVIRVHLSELLAIVYCRDGGELLGFLSWVAPAMELLRSAALTSAERPQSYEEFDEMVEKSRMLWEEHLEDT